MSDVISTVFTDVVLKQLLTLLGLIVLQVALAVALALKLKRFEWGKLADFYSALVLPYALGWAALAIAARLISAELLGPEYSVLVGDSVTWLAWMAVVASLGARIIATARELYGEFTPFRG